MNEIKDEYQVLFAVADPEGGHGPPPSFPDKDYLLGTSWHFLVKKPL